MCLDARRKGREVGTVTPRTLALIVAAIVAILTLWWVGRATLDRAARRSVLRFRSRVDRFKLTKKPAIVAQLLEDGVDIDDCCARMGTFAHWSA